MQDDEISLCSFTIHILEEEGFEHLGLLSVPEKSS